MRAVPGGRPARAHLYMCPAFSASRVQHISDLHSKFALGKKGKGFPYSIPSVGPGADPGVQAVSLQVTVSHPPGDRLPLLSARPAVTSPAAEHHRPLAGTKLYCLVTEAHRCVNNLPKVVTQRCPEHDLNLRPTDRKPKCLIRYTTAPHLKFALRPQKTEKHLCIFKRKTSCLVARESSVHKTVIA